jgi:hypothetical protein
MFGAVAGPLLHGAGSFLGRRAARNAMRADMITIHDAMPEGGAASARLNNDLEGMGREEAKAYADAAPMLEGLNKDGVIRFLRENTLPSDRLEIARAMEFAIGELVEGRAVDVSPILKESAALGRAWEAVKAEIDARTPAGKPGEVLVLLEPQGQDSMGVQRGPMAVLEDETVKTSGSQVAKETGSYRGYGLTKVLVKHTDVTKADVLSIPRIMREYESIVPDNVEHKGRTWVVERSDGRQLVIGESKTEDGGMLATAHLADPRKERPLSARRKGPFGNPSEGSTFQPLARVSTDTDGAFRSGDTRSPQKASLEGSRRNFQSSVTTADTGGGFPPGHTRSPQGKGIIVHSGEAVNSPDAGHGIDFRPETPEAYEPFPPVSKEHAPIFEDATGLGPTRTQEVPGGEASRLEIEAGIDPATGISPEETYLASLEAEGKLSQADKEAFLVHNEETARINALEESALSDVSEPESPKGKQDITTLLGEEHTGVKGQAAINKLLGTQSGHIKGAFTRSDIGKIDLAWGDDTFGLKHIIKQREAQGIDTKQFLSGVSEVIEKGRLKIGKTGNFEIFYTGQVAVVTQTFQGEKMQLLLTAFKTRRQ